MAAAPAVPPPPAAAHDIDALTLNNPYYRIALETGAHLQLVLMSLAPGEAIGAETHADGDQFFRVVAGTGRATVGPHVRALFPDAYAFVRAGERHNIENTSRVEPLKLYTVYGPPQHAPGTFQPAKRAEEHHD